MKTLIKLPLYLLIFPITYYLINTIISVSKKNEIELTFIYETQNTVNNKHLFIDNYLEGKVLSQFEPINFTSNEIHDMLMDVGIIKQDVVSHDPTSKCLIDVDVRNIEMHTIALTKLSLKYTFAFAGNEDDTVSKVIDCNRSVYIDSLSKYIVPTNVDYHITRLQEELSYLPNITLEAKDEVNRKYLIEPITELIEELENLNFLKELSNNNESKELSNLLENFINSSKMNIIMDLKRIEKGKNMNLYEKSNTYDEWYIDSQIKRTNEVINALKKPNLNLDEISYEIYRTEQTRVQNSYSLYIFTILIGALIVVLIENLLRSLRKRNN